jgi:AMP deaminase
MSTEGEDKSAVQTPTPGSSSAGLHIPDAMDGFFGYTEEKSLKQVFGIVI